MEIFRILVNKCFILGYRWWWWGVVLSCSSKQHAADLYLFEFSQMRLCFSKWRLKFHVETNIPIFVLELSAAMCGQTDWLDHWAPHGAQNATLPLR